MLWFRLDPRFVMISIRVRLLWTRCWFPFPEFLFLFSVWYYVRLFVLYVKPLEDNRLCAFVVMWLRFPMCFYRCTGSTLLHNILAICHFQDKRMSIIKAIYISNKFLLSVPSRSSSESITTKRHGTTDTSLEQLAFHSLQGVTAFSYIVGMTFMHCQKSFSSLPVDSLDKMDKKGYICTTRGEHFPNIWRSSALCGFLICWYQTSCSRTTSMYAMHISSY